MLNFHKPSIDDYNWIHDILYPANLPGADNTFHNMYFWECYYDDAFAAAVEYSILLAKVTKLIRTNAVLED